MEDYPQLFDLSATTFAKKGEAAHSALYDRHKAGELSGHVREQYDQRSLSVQQSVRKSVRLSLLLTFGWVPFLILVGGTLEAWADSDVSMATMYNRLPIIFWLMPIFAALGIGLTVLFFYLKKKNSMRLAEITTADDGALERMIDSQLDIPEQTVEIDVFQRICNAKSGKPNPMSNCLSLRMYTKGDYLYIVDLPVVLKILKRDCLTAEMTDSKKRYADAFPLVDYKSPEIKEFKIKQYNNNNQIFYVTPQFGRFLFQTGSELWTVDVPPYHFEQAKKLIKD